MNSGRYMGIGADTTYDISAARRAEYEGWEPEHTRRTVGGRSVKFTKTKFVTAGNRLQSISLYLYIYIQFTELSNNLKYHTKQQQLYETPLSGKYGSILTVNLNKIKKTFRKQIAGCYPPAVTIVNVRYNWKTFLVQ